VRLLLTRLLFCLSKNHDFSSFRSWLIPVALGVIATIIYRFFLGK
jgi:FtsH-binding integral membrane protein